MQTPAFITELLKISSDKIRVNVLTNTVKSKQIMTGKTITKKVYAGCDVITSDRNYFDTLKNTFSARVETITIPTFDCDEVTYTAFFVSKYLLTVKLV